MKLKPQDRRGCHAAGQGNSHCGRELARQGVTLKGRSDARHEHEDGADRDERELEAGVEDVVGIPGEQDERSKAEEVPAVGRACGEPRERAQDARDPGPDHGRLCAHGEDVAHDRADCTALADPARQPQEPGER